MTSSFTRNDLVDVLFAGLAPLLSRPGREGSGAARPSASPGAAPLPARGRRFLTDYEIRRTLSPGAKHLSVPRDAIVSPLALEWLALKGIRVVRESA